MKRPLIATTGLIGLLLTSSLSAKSLRKEAEDYVKDLIRAHPELGKIEPTASKSRDAHMARIGKIYRIFSLSETESELLKKRKNAVSSEQMKAAVDKLKLVANTDPEAKFLIERGSDEKLKREEQLLIYRIIRNVTTREKSEVDSMRRKALTEVHKLIKEYKEVNNAPPKSLADLTIPAEFKQFTDPATGKKQDWVYLGNVAFKTRSSYLWVMEHPIGTADKVMGIREDGAFGTYTYASTVSKLKELEKAGSKPPTKKEEATPEDKPADKAEEPAKPVIDVTIPAGYGTDIDDQLKSIMELYTKFAAEKEINSLDDLMLGDRKKICKSFDGKDGKPWVYVGSRLKVTAGKHQLILMSPYHDHKGQYPGTLSDGSVIRIHKDQFKEIKEKLSN